MPPCAGLRAHIELSKISGFIVCETLQIAPRNATPGQLAKNIDIALQMLRTWHLKLPYNLQMQKDLRHPDPSCCILHMAHHHLMVLTTRPIFFGAVKQAVAQHTVRGEPFPKNRARENHIQVCLAAAQGNLHLARHVIQSGRRPLQAILHFVFNAAMIMLLERLRITRSNTQPRSSDLHASVETSVDDQFEYSICFAMEMFEKETVPGTKYPECYKILQDLRALTDYYVSQTNQADLAHRNVIEISHSSLKTDQESVTDVRTSQLPFGEGSAGHEEIMTWLWDDVLHLLI
jgi:hypothetical protein